MTGFVQCMCVSSFFWYDECLGHFLFSTYEYLRKSICTAMLFLDVTAWELSLWFLNFTLTVSIHVLALGMSAIQGNVVKQSVSWMSFVVMSGLQHIILRVVILKYFFMIWIWMFMFNKNVSSQTGWIRHVLSVPSWVWRYSSRLTWSLRGSSTTQLIVVVGTLWVLSKSPSHKLIRIRVYGVTFNPEFWAKLFKRGGKIHVNFGRTGFTFKLRGMSWF